MFAKDIMNKNVVICTGEMLLMEAYQMMQESEREFVLVVESAAHKNPIGVVTEHDICLQIIGKGRNPRGLTAASVMNSEITKTRDTSTLSFCSNLLDDSRAKRLFVIDEDGALCGAITPKEIAANKIERPIEGLNRSGFLGEYRNAGINRIF